ncbi:MAG: MFS transporter [Dehalococcoidia bacterium]|nr:MAG: MFS transporter [Dehalococcoidia bacterium]
MFGFSIVWLGQLVSMSGSMMTRFALTIWVWQETGEATALAIVALFSFAPAIFFSPIAGAIVDRVSRKRVMIASDLAAGLSTVALLILFSTGHLEIWHLWAAGFFASSFESFQFPAYSAAITTMVEKKHYTRANAMLGMVHSAPMIIAPVLAGSLLHVIGINGIMVIDIATFIFAIGMLLVVVIPNPAETAAGRASRGSLLQESVFGFRYIFSNRSLLGLLLIFLAINLTFTLAMVLLAPMILARTGNNETILGTTMMMFGVGAVVGALIITAWGGFKRRIHGVLLGITSSSLFGMVIVGLGQSIQVWAVGAFLVAFFMPLINGSSQGIWQSKVAPDIQGKVFATRRLIAQISAPVAMILGGRLADVVFEPAMASGGAFAQFFQPLVGSGPGAGMGLLFVFSGIFGAVAALSGYLIPAVRQIETRLPDYDAPAKPVA